MGQARTPKSLPRRVRISNTNYELRITNWRIYFRLFVIFCEFAGNIFAQNNLESLAEAVRSGTTEVKRSALLEIRNLKSAEASRLAIPALRDSDEIVRATAAFSVIYLPKDEAFTVLLPLLQDK